MCWFPNSLSLSSAWKSMCFFVIQRRITLVKTRARRSCKTSQFWRKYSGLPGVVRFDHSQGCVAEWFHPGVEPRDFDAEPTRDSGPEETVACTPDSVPLSWSEENLFTTPTDLSKRCSACSERSAGPSGGPLWRQVRSRKIERSFMSRSADGVRSRSSGSKEKTKTPVLNHFPLRDATEPIPSSERAP